MTSPPAVHRTPLEVEADRFDCDLYRILCQIVQLAGQQNGDAEKALYEAAQKLRTVRAPLRSLMHPYDRERT